MVFSLTIDEMAELVCVFGPERGEVAEQIAAKRTGLSDDELLDYHIGFNSEYTVMTVSPMKA